MAEEGSRHTAGPWPCRRCWFRGRRFDEVVHSSANLIELLSEVLEHGVDGGQLLGCCLAPKVAVLVYLEVLPACLELPLDMVIVDDDSSGGLEGLLQHVER